MKAKEIADVCGSCLYMYPGDPRAQWQIPPQPHDRIWTDCGTLLDSIPAMQRYNGRLCDIKAHEIAVFCGGDFHIRLGDILLDG